MNYCDIIIPVWNEKELTQNCIERIKKYTRYPFRLIVIDNGSNKETSDYLKDERNKSTYPFVLIRNNENLGFLKAANQGFAQAGSPYVCLLNNDTIVCERWLTDMIDLFNKREDIGIANPSSNVLGQYANRENLDDFAALLQSEKGLYQKMDFCRGFCMLIRKSLLDKIGLFDEIFDMGYFEEADFCKRAQKEGIICVRSRSSYVYHIDRTSFKRISDVDRLFQKNKIIFYRKWGKPLWIAFVIESAESAESFVKMINMFLDKGHKIVVLHKKGINLGKIEDHINVRTKEIGFPFFLTLFYKIIERKKEKKLKAIFTYSNAYIFLKYTKFMHKAEVFENNEQNLLMDFCEKTSFDEKYINEDIT